MTYWIDENEHRHNELPSIWNGITPFNELRASEAGWTKIEELTPDPEPNFIDEDVNEAEKAIISQILALAEKYDAIEAMSQLEDITIPSLLGMAQTYGVSDADLQSTETKILILARHLEAITGQTWADTWAGLKSRFAAHVADLLQN